MFNTWSKKLERRKKTSVKRRKNGQELSFSKKLDIKLGLFQRRCVVFQFPSSSVTHWVILKIFLAFLTCSFLASLKNTCKNKLKLRKQTSVKHGHLEKKLGKFSKSPSG